mgnify:CR=1 FL=1
MQNLVGSGGAVLAAAPLPGPVERPTSAWWLICSVVGWYLGAQLIAVLAMLPVFVVEYYAAVGHNDVAGQCIMRWSDAVAATLMIEAVLLLVGVSKARRLGHGNLMQGLGAGPIQRPKLVILLGVALVPAAIEMALVLRHYGLVPMQLVWPGDALPAPTVLALMGSAWVLLTNIAAPICEEVFFRGWLWTALRQRWAVALPR